MNNSDRDTIAILPIGIPVRLSPLHPSTDGHPINLFNY